MARVLVTKRRNYWHWWCDECCGGDWEHRNGRRYSWRDAMVAAWSHLWLRHTDPATTPVTVLRRQLTGL